MIFLSPPPKSWHYRHAPPRLADLYITKGRTQGFVYAKLGKHFWLSHVPSSSFSFDLEFKINGPFYDQAGLLLWAWPPYTRFSNTNQPGKSDPFLQCLRLATFPPNYNNYTMTQTPMGLWSSFYHSWKASWAPRWLNQTSSFMESFFFVCDPWWGKCQTRLCWRWEANAEGRVDWTRVPPVPSLPFELVPPPMAPWLPASVLCHNPPSPCWVASCVAHLREKAGGGWRLPGDLLLCRDFTKLPKLIFFSLYFWKIKHSSESKHHKLTSQPEAQEKCFLLNVLACNTIYEHFRCFDFPPPQSLLFLTPQSEVWKDYIGWFPWWHWRKVIFEGGFYCVISCAWTVNIYAGWLLPLNSKTHKRLGRFM